MKYHSIENIGPIIYQEFDLITSLLEIPMTSGKSQLRPQGSNQSNVQKREMECR